MRYLNVSLECSKNSDLKLKKTFSDCSLVVETYVSACYVMDSTLGIQRDSFWRLATDFSCKPRKPSITKPPYRFLRSVLDTLICERC